MSAIGIPLTTTPRAGNWAQRHPIVTYFAIAFIGTWLLFAPILFSQRGLGLIELSDAAGLVLFFAATYAGPFLAGFAVTAMNEGSAGVRQLVHRIFQWRVGVQWYALLFVGYPAMFIIGLVAVLGNDPITRLAQNWAALLPAYAMNIAIGLILPSLGEETGWRGVALPRLQTAYGPVLGGVTLGVLHALWHLPAYFIKGAILPNGFDLTYFIANSCTIVMATLVWTWLFNNAHASILFAILIHSTSNATSSLIPNLVSAPTGDPWFGFKVVGIVAVTLIVLTRGRLGYGNEIKQSDAGPRP